MREAANRYLTVVEQLVDRVVTAAKLIEGSPEAVLVLREALLDTRAQMVAAQAALAASRMNGET